MSDEDTQDVQLAEETAEDSSTETNQSVDDSTDSEVDNTQDSQPDGGEERTIPYSRFQEVVKDRNQMKQMIEQLGQSQPQADSQQFQPQFQQQEGLSETQIQAREQLKALFREAQAEANRPIEQENAARSKHNDYDEVKPFVDEILQNRPDLQGVANPYETGYMIAKGLMSEYGTQQAKEAGKQEAYKTINQKVASRTDSPVPKKDSGGKSEILRKFQSGQLSPEETRANWLKIQQEMAQQ